MTASQRLRLVIALGAVNLVLAIVALGLAGSNVAPETAVRTPAPSITAGPVAVGSPRPTAAVPKPTKAPVQASPAPSSAPVAPQATAVPVKTPGPVAVVVVPEPAASPAPSAAPVTPPTVAPAGESLRAVPPCPGTTTAAPGLTKQSIDPGRPCRGGETAARPPSHATHMSAAHPRFAQSEFETPVALLTERIRPQTRHRVRRRRLIATA